MNSHEPSVRAYPPAAFVETRGEVLRDFIRAHRFGWLVSAGAEGLAACGAPFVLVETEGRLELQAHLARANPQASHDGAAALVLFAGPHAYVRPAWYDLEAMEGRAVPTWDYIAVQAHGALRCGGGERLARQIRAVTAQEEAGFDDPWSPDQAPADYLERLTRGIVAVTLEVERLEGVWKVHQNHAEPNRRGVVRGLMATGGDDAHAIAAAIEAAAPRGV